MKYASLPQTRRQGHVKFSVVSKPTCIMIVEVIKKRLRFKYYSFKKYNLTQKYLPFLFLLVFSPCQVYIMSRKTLAFHSLFSILPLPLVTPFWTVFPLDDSQRAQTPGWVVCKEFDLSYTHLPPSSIYYWAPQCSIMF